MLDAWALTSYAGSRGSPPKKTADIGRPAGNAAQAEIQTGRDLAPKGVPVAMRIAGPGDGGIALLAGIGRARQNEGAFVRHVAARAVMNGGRVQQWVGVIHLGAGAVGSSDVAQLPPLTAQFGLAAIEPPAVEIQRAQVAHNLLPINRSPRLRIRVIPASHAFGIDIGVRQRVSGAGGIELGKIGGGQVKAWPYGDDRMHLHVVQLFHHGARVGEARRIKRVAAPAALFQSMP
jgi:hypothetical protein